jgi:hypothetical protein
MVMIVELAREGKSTDEKEKFLLAANVVRKSASTKDATEIAK